LYPLFLDLVHSVQRPPRYEDQRPILEYVRARCQPADVVYVHPWAMPSFRFYSLFHAQRFLRHVPIFSVSGNWVPYSGESYQINALRGRRVWVIVSGAIGANEGPIQYFVAQLDQAGKQLDSVEAGTSRGYLYDFSITP